MPPAVNWQHVCHFTADGSWAYEALEARPLLYRLIISSTQAEPPETCPLCTALWCPCSPMAAYAASARPQPVATSEHNLAIARWNADANIHLLGARWELDTGDASIWVVGHHDGVVAGGASKAAAVTSLLRARKHPTQPPRHNLGAVPALACFTRNRAQLRALFPAPFQLQILAVLHLTSSTLQMTVPSGISPTGLMLPMCRVAFLPQKTNCRHRKAPQ